MVALLLLVLKAHMPCHSVTPPCQDACRNRVSSVSPLLSQLQGEPTGTRDVRAQVDLLGSAGGARGRQALCAGLEVSMAGHRDKARMGGGLASRSLLGKVCPLTVCLAEWKA